MSTQIRVTVDIVLDRGDATKVLAFLQKPETSKKLNDFAAHVLIAEEIEGVKVRTVGGTAHECSPSSDYACAACREQSKEWPRKVYPRALLTK